MGFHKRRISEDGILFSYEADGLDGVKKYFSADALIIETGFADEIHDLLIEALTNDNWKPLEKAIKNHHKDVKSL